MKLAILFIILSMPIPCLAQKQTDIATLPLNVKSHYITLNWTESDSVDGFNIYRSVFSAGPYSKIDTTLVSGTNYTDYTVQPGFTYFYFATAVRGGQESSNSNQAQATVPSQ